MIYCPHHQLWYSTLKECLLCEREAYTDSITFVEAFYDGNEDEQEVFELEVELEK